MEQRMDLSWDEIGRERELWEGITLYTTGAYGRAWQLSC